MNNPWLQLPTSKPFVLRADDAIVEAFNTSVKQPFRLRTQLLPEPYSGDPRTAWVLLLQLNPGYAPLDARAHARPAIAAALRENLGHQRRTYQHWYLDPSLPRSPGSEWWTKRLREVIEAVGDPALVARRVAAVEFHGYHSQQFRQIPVTLPSQYYSFDLVAQRHRARS
jgi:hypothetical protein